MAQTLENILLFAQTINRIPVYSDFIEGGLDDMPGGLTPNVVIENTGGTYKAFDLIDYIKRAYNLEHPELGGNAFPDDRYEHMIYDPRTPEPHTIGQAYFCVRVVPIPSSDPLRMMIGFKTRYTSGTETTAWNTDESDNTYTWLDYRRSRYANYTGIDPNNITNADHSFNLLFFLHLSIGEYRMPSDPLIKTGIMWRCSSYEKLYIGGQWTFMGNNPIYSGSALQTNRNIEGPDMYPTMTGYSDVYRYKCNGGVVYNYNSDDSDYTRPCFTFGYQIWELLSVCGDWNIDPEDIPQTWFDTGEEPPAPPEDYDQDGYDGHQDEEIKRPTKSIASCGLFQLYTPTTTELRQLSQYLWSNDSETAYQRWGIHAIDNIVLLGCIPFKISNDIIGSKKDIYMMGTSTNVQASELTNAFDVVNLGSVTIDSGKMSGSYLDYTQAAMSMYVPCVGIVPLKASDVINSSMNLRYGIDLLSGDFIARLCVTRYDSTMKHVIGGPFCLYTWTGNCMQTYPLSSADYASYYTNKRHEIFNILGGALGLVGDALNISNDKATNGASMLNKANSMWDSMNWLQYQTPEVQRTGSLGGGVAHLCSPTPYVIIDHAKPYRYSKDIGVYNGFYQWHGYPSMITCKLSDVSTTDGGYTEVARVKVNVAGATAKEKAMIENTLKSGVVIRKVSNS